MDRLLHIAATAASELFKSQAMRNHNLANANTSGFKGDVPELFSLPVYGDGYPTRAYVGLSKPGNDFAAGGIETTGSELDIVAEGKTWIAVQGTDGGEYYTKRGDLMLSASNFLINGSGHLILGDGGPIFVPPAQKISIGSEGGIEVIPQGSLSNARINIGQIKLAQIDSKSLQKTPEGVFKLKSGENLVLEGRNQIKSGVLESSNVNPVGELVGLLDNARQCELNMRMMITAKENDEALARGMHIS